MSTKKIVQEIIKETGLTFGEMGHRFSWAVEAKMVWIFHAGEYRQATICSVNCAKKPNPGKPANVLIHFAGGYTPGLSVLKIYVEQLAEYCKYYNLLGDNKVWKKRKREIATIWVKTNRAENKEFDKKWEQLKAEDKPGDKEKRMNEGKIRKEKKDKKEEERKIRKLRNKNKTTKTDKKEKETQKVKVCEVERMQNQLQKILEEKGHIKKKPNN
jgi:hypothetical protein